MIKMKLFTIKSVDCLRVLYAIVRLISGKTMVSILYVDLISCRYFFKQLNNSIIERPITQDYTDPSSSLGVSDKDLCTNSQAVIYW